MHMGRAEPNVNDFHIGPVVVTKGQPQGRDEADSLCLIIPGIITAVVKALEYLLGPYTSCSVVQMRENERYKHQGFPVARVIFPLYS